MGIMSKTSRVAERPKPPNLVETEEDLLNAKETDIALVVGEKYRALANNDIGFNKSVPPNSDSESSPGLSANGSIDSDQTETSQAEIKESYDKVQRLLELYSSLKDVPGELESKISKLRVMGADMLESISRLKSLSQDMDSTGCDPSTTSSAEGSQQSSITPRSKKEKAKTKRKK